MLSPSTLHTAAQIIADVTPQLPADAALRRALGTSPRMEPREKRAVSRAVFAYFRWCRWCDPRDPLTQQLAATWALQERFTADIKSVKPEALAARAVPAWLRGELSGVGSDLPGEFLRQLQLEPALWLRARPGTAATLASSLGDCVVAPTARACSASPVGSAPEALRYTGQQDLFRTPEFHAGAFEIQDLASQLVGQACAPQSGETWWDACAGEGGKTLHLADLMQNRGLVWATDRSARRLDTLRRRAARAQLFNYRAELWEGGPKLPTKAKFDGILVDAPCSGVGTWQRNPHARWTTTPDDGRELAAAQHALLQHVAGSLKPGGRLIYAVCTLTHRETTAVAAAFTAAHPELEPAAVWQPGNGAPTTPSSVTLWPHELNANGMFIAAWRRKA